MLCGVCYAYPQLIIDVQRGSFIARLKIFNTIREEM